MNEPTSMRTHIGIFGNRNSGKSSLINAITNQNLSIVSDVLGTTTDPVYKSMEILPLGAVMLIDTPGLDDSGELGVLRIEKTYDVLKKCDVAIIVCDATVGMTETEINLINECKNRNISYITVMNKSDEIESLKEDEFYVSTKTNYNIDELKEKIGHLIKNDEKFLIRDLIKPNEIIVMVTPIDDSAPKGRIILPQQQVLREILDNNSIAIVTTPKELETTLESLKNPPKLVITDSQAFKTVAQIVPENIFLTSFSILFARKKGQLDIAVKGAAEIDNLEDNSLVLISEGCTHHRQCNDIGTVKLPNLIKKYTGKNLTFEFTSGSEFPIELSKYSLIIHCGGCMLNDKEVSYRYSYVQRQNVPITNYGIAIAKMNDILKRSTQYFEK